MGQVVRFVPRTHHDPFLLMPDDVNQILIDLEYTLANAKIASIDQKEFESKVREFEIQTTADLLTRVRHSRIQKLWWIRCAPYFQALSCVVKSRYKPRS